MDALAKAGLTSEIRSAESRATKEVASTKCEVADARIARLTAELRSAKRGVFVRDGTNDVPYSQQQRDRMFIRQAGTRASKAAGDFAHRTACNGNRNRAGAPEENCELRPDVAGNTRGVVDGGKSGSAVTEGQTILDLADCAHKFVAVELPERDFEKVKVGSTANVRLVGSDEWLTGRVQNIRGSAANSDHRLFAAQVRTPTPGTITVEVALPGRINERGDGNFCGIGRLAEVHFPRAISGCHRRYARFFDWLTGNSRVAVAAQTKDTQ